jgi:hypothetical protein
MCGGLRVRRTYTTTEEVALRNQTGNDSRHGTYMNGAYGGGMYTHGHQYGHSNYMAGHEYISQSGYDASGRHYPGGGVARLPRNLMVSLIHVLFQPLLYLHRSISLVTERPKLRLKQSNYACSLNT